MRLGSKTLDREVKVISESYAREQRRLHAVDPMFGAEGYQWGYLVAGIVALEGYSSILDYGCGKGTLKKLIDGADLSVGSNYLVVREYDPGVEGKDSPPAAADLVVCLDVLEHIEPDCLDQVFLHLASVARKALFVVVSTKLSKRIMADGRDTHISLHEDTWWATAFKDSGFKIKRIWNTGLRLWVALLEPPC